MILTNKQAQSNIWKLYACQFLTEMMFFAPILIPFFGSLGFSLKEIMIIEAIFFGTIALFEIPSGYFADLFGRKKTLVWGSLFFLVGAFIYAISSKFIGFFVGNFLWGMGYAFTSGANSALLYESLLKLNREDDYKKVQGDVIFYGQMAFFVSALAGGFMTLYTLRTPLYATLVPLLFWLFISFFLYETRHVEKHEKWEHFIKIFKESFLHNPKIRSFCIFSGMIGFLTIAYYLGQKYLEFINVPVAYFGVIISINSLLGGIGAKYAHKFENILGFKKLILSFPLIPIIVWIILANMNSLWAIIPLLFVGAFWGMANPIFKDYVNKRVTSDRRATILSTMSFIQNGVFIIFSPFIGWISDIYSVQTAFFISAILLSIYAFCGYILLQKAKAIDYSSSQCF